MKEVLLIGDSIRMYSQNRICELIGEEYHVSAPEENCKFSTYTLNTLRVWLEQFPKPDIIHWNNGLWDTAILYQEDGCFTPLELYLENLKKILRELRKTGAEIIFASITPVDPKKANPPEGFSVHHNEDIQRYNRAALALMEQENVIINDLYPLMIPHLDSYIRQDDLIHPTEEGIEVIAREIVNKIHLANQKRMI